MTNRDGGIKWPVGGISSKYRVQGTEENTAIDKNMQILVVDDYNTMLRILKNLLKQLGFHIVDQAMDGNEALQKLKASAFDFIISDWNMEPMTGIELLREVRGNEKL